MQLGAALQDAGAERLAQARERRREQGFVSGRGAFAGPQGLRELISADWTVAIEGKIGKEDPPLAPTQGVFEPPSLELNDESTAQLDAGRFPHDHGRQSIRRLGSCHYLGIIPDYD